MLLKVGPESKTVYFKIFTHMCNTHTKAHTHSLTHTHEYIRVCDLVYCATLLVKPTSLGKFGDRASNDEYKAKNTSSGV